MVSATVITSQWVRIPELGCCRIPGVRYTVQEGDMASVEQQRGAKHKPIVAV